MISINQKTYAAPDIVRYYRSLQLLQPAEMAILATLGDLTRARVLDVGVGGGRTTGYFAQNCGEYIGIDLSAAMVAACVERFAHLQNLQFWQADARDLSRFDERSFDLVLFSFNGIDYVDHGDRLRILAEVERVLKIGGMFCFSSHNLQGLAAAWQAQWSANPLITYTNLVMVGILRLLNRDLNLAKLKTLDYAIATDESHNFRLRTYYIRPRYQLQQLSAFGDLQVYVWHNGKQLPFEQLDQNTDMWLYYCGRRQI